MLRPTARLLALAAALAVPGAAPLPAVAGDEDPKTPQEAMERARGALEKARTTPPVSNKESRDHMVLVESVNGALDLLKGQSKEGFGNAEFQALWNDAVSLGHFHGVKKVPDFQLQTRDFSLQPLRAGLPVGRGWALKEHRIVPNEQLCAEITRSLAEGRVTRHVKIWFYKWNTSYSGTGGENAKGLAEKDLENDREGMKKISFRSNRVVTARLSRGFPKTSYYEIAGEDEKLGPLRRRNYYVKGKTTTYNFEVIEYRLAKPDDDPWTKWQVEGDDPELKAVLESLEDTGDRKR
jgi:hypothetical protein